MNTPSHFLMTAAIGQAFSNRSIARKAFLLGSIAPDLPLWLLSLGGLIYYHGWLGWSLAKTMQLMYDELYFQNAFWISSHNLLHSPLLLAIGLGLVWRNRHHMNSPSRWWFWFLVACSLHSIVDIFTHVDDGPLLLFPLNWNWRFHSPVSYYDDRYYGQTFQGFEFGLDVLLLLYLALPRLFRRFR